MAFQIVDDVINLYPQKGDDKDAFNDIIEGKSTLPMIYIFKEMPGLIKKLVSTDSPTTRRDEVIPYLDSEILSKCRKTASGFLDKAISAISEAGFLSEKILKLPQIILGPIEGRL
jgi:geranylgeranyl pyrophosphate synthase